MENVCKTERVYHTLINHSRYQRGRFSKTSCVSESLIIKSVCGVFLLSVSLADSDTTGFVKGWHIRAAHSFPN